jgi:hypothetical protein
MVILRSTGMAPTKPRAPQKLGTAIHYERRSSGSAADQATSHKVIDNPGVTEQFANQLIDVLVVNGHTVSITLGARRSTRDRLHGESETAIAINTRLTLDMQTAEALHGILGQILLSGRKTQGSVN